MKYEETNDIATMLVEANDDLASLVHYAYSASDPDKTLVILLPERANRIFRQPDDFSKLQLLQGQRSRGMVLVIPGNAGNERLRSWARGQGFSVFASAEICVQALLAQYGPLSVQQHTLRGASSPLRLPQRMPLSAVATLPPPVSLAQLAPASAGAWQTSGTLALAGVERNTEPLTFNWRQHWPDRLVLLLAALVVLGILGGLGFGYLLHAAHAAPAILLR